MFYMDEEFEVDDVIDYFDFEDVVVVLLFIVDGFYI